MTPVARTAHRRARWQLVTAPLDHANQAAYHHVPADEQRDGGRDLPLVAGDPVLEPLDRLFCAQRPEQVKRERTITSVNSTQTKTITATTCTAVGSVLPTRSCSASR